MPTMLDSVIDEHRAMLRLKRAEYQDAITRIDEILVAMGDEGNGQPAQILADTPAPAPKPRKRKMSAAARAAVSKRMKAYWRKRRRGK